MYFINTDIICHDKVYPERWTIMKSWYNVGSVGSFIDKKLSSDTPVLLEPLHKFEMGWNESNSLTESVTLLKGILVH